LKTEDGNVSSVSKRKKHSKRSDITRTFKFIQVQQTIDDRKSMKSLAKECHVSEGTIRNVVT